MIIRILNRWYDRWQGLNFFVKRAIILLACIVLNLSGFFGFSQFTQWRAEEEYIKPFGEADRVMESVINRHYPHLSSFRTQILQNQYAFLEHKKEFFKMRLVRFYVGYIGVVACSLMMTLILAGLLGLIANTGWTRTGPSTRFLFVTIALFTTLHASVLTVFDLQDNATNNLRLFIDHKSVQIDIYDHLTTSERFTTTDSTKAKIYANTDSLIHNVNLQIKALNQVFYSIDQSQINAISLDAYLSKVGAK